MDDLKHNQNDNVQKLIAVIISWNNNEPSTVTWETVINGMKGPIVNNQFIADMIHQYLSGGKSSKLLSYEHPRLCQQTV